MDILVYGYYNQGNIGDELFKRAIPKVLGEAHRYTFSEVMPANVNDYDRLVVGGGSFLDQPIQWAKNAVKVTVPAGFLGVGIHGTVIHKDWHSVYAGARVIVVRNEIDLPRDMVLPDLAYVLMPEVSDHEGRPDRSGTLVILNGFLMPTDRDDYRYAPMKNFRFQMELLERDHGPLKYQAMQCQGIDDGWLMPSKTVAAATEDSLLEAITQAASVVSTRFHGCVLSAMLGTPFVGLSPHDKMQSFFEDAGWTNYFDYFNFYVGDVRDALKESPSSDHLIDSSWLRYAEWANAYDDIRTGLKL